jgi:hypothetical protein
LIDDQHDRRPRGRDDCPDRVLRTLTETIASGHGAQPNGDVLAATGTAPICFADFASKTAPAWK